MLSTVRNFGGQTENVKQSIDLGPNLLLNMNELAVPGGRSELIRFKKVYGPDQTDNFNKMTELVAKFFRPDWKSNLIWQNGLPVRLGTKKISDGWKIMDRTASLNQKKIKKC